MTRTPLERVVVAGASLAGLRAAERLRAEGFDGTLTIVGAEPHAPYDRPPLSKELLAGTRQATDVALRVLPELGAEWILGDAATGLDLHARRLRTASGRELPFDGLVIATGSTARRLPALDPALPGVHELRTLDDALALRAALAGRPRVVLVGCGFIGVEVASTAVALGAEVEIVTLDPALCIAGPLVSGTAGAMLADHGVRVRVGVGVERVLGDGRVEALVLTDGTRADADHVVVAAGAVPATGWLDGSGLELDGGVVCDAASAAAGAERVVAAGDVARWPNPVFGGLSMRVEHWTNAVEQGMAAARTLLHGSSPETAYRSVPGFWSEHFGTRLQSVGLPGLADRTEIVEGSVDDGRFVAAAYRDDALVGAVTYGNARGLAPFRAELGRRSAPVAAGAGA
jgi:3-phenylpropionate/trans-cinnamate dioxygenase ferredoxin reductase subunit